MKTLGYRMPLKKLTELFELTACILPNYDSYEGPVLIEVVGTSILGGVNMNTESR